MKGIRLLVLPALLFASEARGIELSTYYGEGEHYGFTPYMSYANAGCGCNRGGCDDRCAHIWAGYYGEDHHRHGCDWSGYCCGDSPCRDACDSGCSPCEAACEPACEPPCGYRRHRFWGHGWFGHRRCCEPAIPQACGCSTNVEAYYGDAYSDRGESYESETSFQNERPVREPRPAAAQDADTEADELTLPPAPPEPALDNTDPSARIWPQSGALFPASAG